MPSQDIPYDTLMKVNIACLTISCVVVVLRTGARWYKTRRVPVDTEDIFMYIGFCCMVGICGLYLNALPRLKHITLVGTGLKAPYANIRSDLTIILKSFLTIQVLYWGTLWSVKLSLLFMFRKLTTGLLVYTRIWWAVLAFTIVSFILCVVSAFTCCSSMHAWFSPDSLCNTPRDTIAKAVSLWYSLSVDLLTDLMIMAIPVQALYKLRIPTVQKFSVGFVFMVGILTMIAALLRTVSLETSTPASGNANTTWLVLFLLIESTTSMVVGCLPPFAVFIRGRVVASRAPEYTPGYSGGSTNKAKDPTSYISNSRAKSRARDESIMLDDAATSADRHSVDDRSNKSLVDGTIVITQGWSQRWHRGTREDEQRERVQKLGLSIDI